ncbi:M4WV, histidine kinase-group IX protein [Mollisia scopiformis]|uniref:histidine kinase n=1 Tax=Mollisia scopiformis TaxID=149040 RepID=A0A194X5I2_MOLSC|nr:M4WV, histidine kinase-group IX protein [Mollisia scopiformis]KUJ15072.1 M4WV, histidine kinase-group IX protein [Mollisia scopiformis]
MQAQSGSAFHAGIEFQLATLRNLPTPILVLSPLRVIIFANRGGQRVLGSTDPTRSPELGIAGKTPTELGIKLLYNRQWNVVLDKFLSEQKSARSEGKGINEDAIHEVDAVVTNSHLNFEEKYYRILISAIDGKDGCQFVLSLEKSPHVEKKLIPRSEEPLLRREEGIPAIPRDPVHDSPTVGSRDIARIKKAVFDSSDVPGFILSVDEKFYLTNKKAREVIGDVMGDDKGCTDGLALRELLEIWDETFTKRLDPTEFPGLKLVRNKQPFTDYRCGFTHAVTGERVFMSVNGECLYDDDTGEFMGGICWCKDLQEYSDFLCEQQRQRLESHETTCNLLPHLVWTTTRDGECDWFSERWYQFTGMTKEESLGSGFQEAIHPDDFPLLMEKWEHHREAGNECEVEIRYRRHDGLYKWMLARACPLRDEQGRILKWYGTNTDIHDLVMARNKAARNKLQMLTVLAHAEVNLFSINKDRIVTMAEGSMRWDSEAEEYDARHKINFLGKDAIEVAQHTQPGGVPGYERIILDVLSGKVGVAQSEDTINGRTFRTRVAAELEHNAADGGQKPEVIGVLGLTIDVTDMKARAALEVDNTRLMMEEQAAKDSNKMKSQFLANMSHEMRTPTAGVIGMVELLGEDPTLTPEQREYVNSIQLSAKALLTIVNDILDFSKIESGRLDIEEVPFNLSSVVGELCKLLGMFAQQKGLDFIYEDNMDGDLEVLGDPGRTRQVLSNLLTNALKFTKEGSVKLAVTSTTTETNGDEIVEARFLIEDTGIGIEKDVLDKLFQPFSQGDSSTARLYGGTGLGLTISKNLASLMNGSIELESTPKQGSKATFIVPFKVSSWTRTSVRETFSTSPNLGFHTRSTWKQPLAHRSINQDLLNQQISASVTTSFPSLSQSSSRHPSLDNTFNLQIGSLTPEQRSKTHVLVVEDNPINQTIAIKNIHRLGFPVTAVWNGREALSYLLNPSPTQPRPAVILMDVQMPVMDGYEATRILRTNKDYAVAIDTGVGASSAKNVLSLKDRIEEKEPEAKKMEMLRDIPVIAMTASAIQGDREKCHEAGMDDYLAKPVERGSLEQMLLKWAGRKRDG